MIFIYQKILILKKPTDGIPHQLVGMKTEIIAIHINFTRYTIFCRDYMVGRVVLEIVWFYSSFDCWKSQSYQNGLEKNKSWLIGLQYIFMILLKISEQNHRQILLTDCILNISFRIFSFCIMKTKVNFFSERQHSLDYCY